MIFDHDLSVAKENNWGLCRMINYRSLSWYFVMELPQNFSRWFYKFAHKKKLNIKRHKIFTFLGNFMLIRQSYFNTSTPTSSHVALSSQIIPPIFIQFNMHIQKNLWHFSQHWHHDISLRLSPHIEILYHFNCIKGDIQLEKWAEFGSKVKWNLRDL